MNPQDAVIVEVALLDAALLDRQLAVERRAEPEGDRRLHLRGDPQRIDADAAIDRADDAVHPDAPVLHRNLRHVGHDAAERLVHGEPPRLPRGRRGAPAGLLRRQLQHRAHPRRLLQQRPPEFQRVPLGRVRQLVHERLHGERGVRMPHRAPPEHRHPRIGGVEIDAMIGDRRHIGGVRGPLHRRGIDAVPDHAGERRAGHDRLRDHAMTPGHRVPPPVQRPLDPMDGHRTVVAAADVVVARPHHLDRLLVILRHVGRLGHEIRGDVRPPPEAAAQEGGVNGHLLRLEAEDLRHPALVHRLELRPRPHLAPVHRAAHRAVERLHGSVGEIGQRIFGHQYVRSQRLLHVPAGRGLGARRLRFLQITFAELHRVDVRVRTRIPVDLERVAPLLGRPEMIGRHRHPRRHREHRAHPGHGLGRRRVEPLHRAAERGRVGHHRGEHPRQLDVHAELGAAGDLLRRVEPAGGLANHLPVRRVLELDLLGRRLLRRRRGQRAVAGALVAADHEALLRVAIAGRHTPPGRRRRHQERARHGAHLAIAVELGPRGGRAAGHLDGEDRRVIFRRRGRVLDADAAPVGVQLLVDHHRQRGPDPLAHLRVREQHGDALVAADAQEGVDRRQDRRRGGRLLREGEPIQHGRHEEAHHQPAARPLEERAPRQPAHDRPSISLAARCTALRMR